MSAKWSSLLKDSAGRPWTVQLHMQAVKSDLPKLIWMKRRIESLLQCGKTNKAITLAEKANLVCRGAAFIAWDDAEEVAIAQDEVYQPSLKVPSGLPSSTHSRPRAAFMPASFMPASFMPASFMPACSPSSPARRPSLPE
jgi:hypothetical protein